MDDKVEKLLKLGKSPEELQKFISKLDAKTLCGIVGSSLYARHICDVLRYIFAGLSSSESCQAKRYKVIEKLLNELRKDGEKCYKENDIFVIVNIQLQKMDSKYLVNLTEYCIEWAQNGSPARTGWKLLLPNLLNLLARKTSVECEDGDTKSGAAYLSDTVRSLSAVQWRPAVLTDLAIVFCDVVLSSRDHLELVTALCRCMHRMAPADLPLYTYQLLILCRREHSIPVFMNLDQYFHSRLLADSESPGCDDMEADETEVKDVEERVLLQICFPEVNTNDLFRHLKIILAAPDLLLKHFTFALLMSLSTVEQQKEEVCDLFKKVFLRCHAEENRKMASQWLTSMFPQKNSAELTVSFFIQQRSSGNSIVLRGMLNLGFALLSIRPVKCVPGKDSGPEKLWSLGSYVVVSLAKSVRGNAGPVLRRLYGLIMSSEELPHYTGCLHELCLRVPKEVYECRKEVAQFVSNLLYMRSEMAEGVVKALMPLTKHFQPIKDALIIALRKALYVNDSAKRQMGVRGILDLLKQQGLRGLSVLTQNFVHPEGLLSPVNDSPFSQHSSQVSADSSSICQEVLNILQTVFQKQGAEKIILYSGLCDASVFKNTNLLPAVQELLWSQLEKYLESDEAQLPPLSFDKAVVVQGMKTVVKEPLAHLVYVNQRMSAFKLLDSQAIDTEPHERILNSLCARMVETKLEDFDFGPPDFLADNLPESLRKQEVLRMVLNTYEALISYCVDSWGVDSRDQGSTIASLYDSYSSIVDFTKTSTKSSKKVDNNETQPGKRKRGSGVDAASARSTPFKLPSSILSFESANRLLELFQSGPVSWSCPEAANELKGKRHFWRYVMQAILSLTAQFQALKPAEMKNSPVVAEITKCGRLLYKNFVTKLDETAAFDYITAALAIECLYEIFHTVFTHLKSTCSKFLAEIGLNSSQVLDDQLGALIERYKVLLEQSLELEEGEEEPELKKSTQLLIQTLTLIARQLPGKSLEQMYVWMTELVESKETSNVQAAKAAVSLLLELHHRCKLRGPLLANMARFLCSSRGTVGDEPTATDGPTFRMISKAVEVHTYGMLCNWIMHTLNDVKWTVSWLKAQCTSQMKSGVTVCDDTGRWDELRDKERATCLHLSHVIQELAQVSAVRVPVGAVTTATFRAVLLLYDALHLVAKYFTLRCTRTNQAHRHAKLEGVIRVIKKVLQPRFTDLTHYVSQSDGADKDVEKQEKKKKKLSLDPLAMKNKAINETKLIPKVIFAKEKFEKVVIMLSKKTKSNLEDALGGPKDQDFKIRLSVRNDDE
ncbi:Fanconi anemia group I protein homolog [Bacillus rossius redtenbacheri]|uniref:Fanconi anemia group I protein homolog n=1 Tax=Bacillus rossius redtenbacheri TaxID=93214 RepID=UPI002FDC90F5